MKKPKTWHNKGISKRRSTKAFLTKMNNRLKELEIELYEEENKQ